MIKKGVWCFNVWAVMTQVFHQCDLDPVDFGFLLSVRLVIVFFIINTIILPWLGRDDLWLTLPTRCCGIRFVYALLGSPSEYFCFSLFSITMTSKNVNWIEILLCLFRDARPALKHSRIIRLKSRAFSFFTIYIKARSINKYFITINNHLA